MFFWGENERGAKIGSRKRNERSEAWEKYCEKLDRRQATAYIPAINAMSGLFVSATADGY